MIMYQVDNRFSIKFFIFHLLSSPLTPVLVLQYIVPFPSR